MGNVHMEAAQINYRGGEKKMTVEEALKTTSGEAAAIAQLQQDVTDLNTGKANKADIATEFSDLTNYNAGDLVYYEGDLYEFQVDHTAGAWETSEVVQKDLSDIVTTLMSGLMGLIAEVVTSEPVAASGGVTVQYPSGFSYSNTAVVSVYITDGNAKYVGDEFAKATLTQWNIGLNNKMTSASYVVGVVLAKVS